MKNSANFSTFTQFPTLTLLFSELVPCGITSLVLSFSQRTIYRLINAECTPLSLNLSAKPLLSTSSWGICIPDVTNTPRDKILKQSIQKKIKFQTLTMTLYNSVYSCYLLQSVNILSEISKKFIFLV